MTRVSVLILSLYGLAQALVIHAAERTLRKGAQDVRKRRRLRACIFLPYAVLAALPVGAALLPESAFSLALQRLGNVFLAFDIHIVVFWLLAAIAFRLAHAVRRKKRGFRARMAALVIAGIAGTVVPVCGMMNARNPALTYQVADVRRNTDEGKSIRIALIADLHLGVNSHVETTRKMVGLINSQEPDLVLVAGDTFTSSYRGLRDPELYSAELREIRASLGVYAVYGNHDVAERLFAGFAIRPVEEAFRPKEMEEFFADSNFTILADQGIDLADGSLYLAGRLDESKAGDGTADRLPAGELLRDAGEGQTVLVLEHEPVEYEELRAAGTDLVFSGHTHNGQIFPGSLYVKLVNANSYGKKTVGEMETFVTAGVGTFGPPMRTGTKSEVMIIDVLYTP